MPTIDIDLFDDEPKVGDKVKVMGKVKSIDEESGDVEVSYNDVTIVKKPRKNRRDRKDDDDDDTIYFEDNDPNNPNPQMNPNSQSLDQALSQSFGTTQ